MTSVSDAIGTHDHVPANDPVSANDQVTAKDQVTVNGTRIETSRPGLGVRVALVLLRAYQGAASGRISPCRFYPSCSNYAAEAFSVHGFWRGLALTARRLVRCRPFGPHGVDLVPVPARAAAAAPVHDGGCPC